MRINWEKVTRFFGKGFIKFMIVSIFLSILIVIIGILMSDFHAKYGDFELDKGKIDIRK